MKNLIAILAVLITLSTASYGQSFRSGSLQAKTAAGTAKSTPDTTTNTDTTYLYSGRNDCNQWNVSYYWSAIPSISGTTTSGTTVTAEGSNTGTFAYTGDWVPLISDVTQYTSTYPVTISGSTAIVKYLQLPKCQFKYVRLKIVTAGTQTSVYTGSYTFAAPYVGGL